MTDTIEELEAKLAEIYAQIDTLDRGDKYDNKVWCMAMNDVFSLNEELEAARAKANNRDQ